MKQRQIIVFTGHFIPHSAGKEIHIYETCTRLVRAGWQVKVFTSKNTHQAKNVLPGKENIDGVHIQRFSDFNYNFPFWVPGIDFSNSIVCFHGTNYLSDLYIYVYILFLKIIGKKDFKVVFLSHGMYSYHKQCHSGVSGWLKWHSEMLVSKLLLNNIVDGFVSVSNWESKFMKLAGITDITVLPNGISSEAFVSKPPALPANLQQIINSYPNFIIQIGRIERLKNYEVTIRALSEMALKNLHYFIVGPVKELRYKQELLNLIQSLNLQDRVHFLDEVTGNSKYSLLHKSRAYVQLSKSEGFGITVVEAMSQGCVCLVSSQTALSELVANGVNGFVIPPTDDRTLASRLNDIIDPKKTREINAMKITNLALAKTYHWDRVAHLYEKYYSSFI